MVHRLLTALIAATLITSCTGRDAHIEFELLQKEFPDAYIKRIAKFEENDISVWLITRDGRMFSLYFPNTHITPSQNGTIIWCEVLANKPGDEVFNKCNFSEFSAAINKTIKKSAEQE